MFKNISAQWARMIFTIIIGLLMPRFMNQYLGTSLYGTWQSLVALTGIIQLFALGVPMASVRFISRAIAKKDNLLIGKIVSTCIGIYCLIGIVSLLFGTIFVFLYYSYFSAPFENDYLRLSTIISAMIVLTSSSLSFLCRFPYSIMSSYSLFIPLNVIKTLSFLIKNSIVLAVLVSTRSIIHLSIIEVVIVLSDLIIGYTYIKKKNYVLSFNVRHFDKSLVREILTFGGYIFVLNMGIRLSFNIDALVIANRLSYESVAFYGASNTIFIQIVEIMISVAAVIMPMATRMETEGKRGELKNIFLKWSKITFSLTLVITIYLLVFGSDFVGIWMGDSQFISPTKGIMPILIISGFFFFPIRAVAMPMLFAFGDVRNPSIAFLVAGVSNLILSFFLATKIGLIGVAIGTALPNLFFSLYVLYVTCKYLDIGLKEWFFYVYFKCILGSSFMFFALYYFSTIVNIRSAVDIMSSGLIYTLLFSIVWYYYVYRNDIYLNLSTAMFKRK